MGCRCCKMIQSYIFDPQEVQTSGYVNEINNYKSDEQDGSRFNRKRNNDIQVHKNELQNADFHPPVNKLNNTKDAVWNHKSTVLREEGLGNCVEKSTFNINGIHSYSGVNLNPSPSTSQSNDGSTDICSDQLSNSSAKGHSQPKECDDDKSTEDHPKRPPETTESVQYKESPSARQHSSSAQSVICEIQGSDRFLLASGDSQIASQAGTQRDLGSEHQPNNHTHTHQSTEDATLSQHGDLPSCKSRSCDSGDEACRTGPLSVCFKGKTSDDIPPPSPTTEAAQEVKYADHEELNGEVEEDAEVAEALAALAAATAGEDLEEEEEY